MADKSFGQFGSHKWMCQDPTINPDQTSIDQISDHCKTNIKYFEKNFQPKTPIENNYSWERPSEESPSIFTRHPTNDHPDDDRYKHTLELNSQYKGYPHVIDQNKWEAVNCGAPVFKDEPQQRHYAILSTQTKYAEEMNKAFPGYPMF